MRVIFPTILGSPSVQVNPSLDIIRECFSPNYTFFPKDKYHPMLVRHFPPKEDRYSPMLVSAGAVSTTGRRTMAPLYEIDLKENIRNLTFQLVYVTTNQHQNKLDVVQLCETQKVRLFHVMVGLMGLCR